MEYIKVFFEILEVEEIARQVYRVVLAKLCLADRTGELLQCFRFGSCAYSRAVIAGLAAITANRYLVQTHGTLAAYKKSSCCRQQPAFTVWPQLNITHLLVTSS